MSNAYVGRPDNSTNKVVGPGSSTDNAVARFDGTSGLLIQDSGVILDDANDLSGLNSIAFSSGPTIDEFSTDGTLSGNSDTALPTEKAVKTYVDGKDHSKLPLEINFSAAEIWALQTTFAPLVKVVGSIKSKYVRSFVHTSTTFVNQRIEIPNDVASSGNVVVTAIVWASTAAAAKNGGFTFYHSAVADGADWDVNYASDTFSGAINETQDKVTFLQYTADISTLAGWTAGNTVDIGLSRDNTVSDNLQSALYLDSLNFRIPRA